MSELPIYKSKKELRAMRIDNIIREKVQNTDSSGAKVSLQQLDDDLNVEFEVIVSQSFITAMKPRKGDYFVDYGSAGTGVIEGGCFNLDYEPLVVYTEEDAKAHLA